LRGGSVNTAPGRSAQCAAAWFNGLAKLAPVYVTIEVADHLVYVEIILSNNKLFLDNTPKAPCSSYVIPIKIGTMFAEAPRQG
jgi:hypothetical protein